MIVRLTFLRFCGIIRYWLGNSGAIFALRIEQYYQMEVKNAEKVI